MTTGSASIVVDRPVAEVFGAVADITRMGQWSPECTGGRWVAPAIGPALGAKFEGDNVAKVGPITVKRWTTTSVITSYVPNKTLEFLAEGMTTWRYDFEDRGGTATAVTETFSHPPYTGWQKFIYGRLARRDRAMVKGIESTLARIKTTLEASGRPT